MVDDNRDEVAVQEPPVTFLTPKDIQRELQIGEGLCYRLLKSGEIPSVRIGGVYRIPRRCLEKALLNGSDVEAQ